MGSRILNRIPGRLIGQTWPWASYVPIQWFSEGRTLKDQLRFFLKFYVLLCDDKGLCKMPYDRYFARKKEETTTFTLFRDMRSKKHRLLFNCFFYACMGGDDF